MKYTGKLKNLRKIKSNWKLAFIPHFLHILITHRVRKELTLEAVTQQCFSDLVEYTVQNVAKEIV